MSVDSTAVDVDVILHSTESIEKMHHAFEDVLGIRRDEFDVHNTEGHFDNQIRVLRASVAKKTAADAIKRIASGISTHDMHEILGSVNEEDDAIYLRLDKQEFVLGRIAAGQKNAIRLRIYSRRYRREGLYQMCCRLLGAEPRDSAR